MYESEANLIVDPVSELPAEILEHFSESRKTVTKRTLIAWGEHCTECVWPTCYSTCDLYSARGDGRCRRFTDGMVRLPFSGGLNTYLLKIKFKRWAKLWSAASLKLYSLGEADSAERSDLRVAAGIQLVPLDSLRTTLIQKRYSWKKRWANRGAGDSGSPNCMLVECYNPSNTTVRMTLTIRAENALMPFQALLAMAPGFNRHRIGIADIANRVDLSSKLDLELTPNEIADGCTLYFGALDFVLDQSYSPERLPQIASTGNGEAKPKICKCVVWDLDNTLWDGVLIEDGLEKLQLKPSIPEILRALDERGILISAVSKNNPEDGLAALKHFGIADYFLFPQISWDPKSIGIQKVARSLNIGIDSLLFVDDSVFEREQAKSECPELTVLDAVEYRSILDRADCQAPVTDESRKRRLLYREQHVRDTALEGFEGDYFSFLRRCRLQLTLRPMMESNLERVHELAQRTNQMNFSGNRYTREQLRQLLANPEIDTYVLDCEDCFGAYGTIGFCTVNRSRNCMTDLMLSCRIQAKRVEHAFISYILNLYRTTANGDFLVNYRKTKKNAGPGQVFADFGFEAQSESDGVTHLVYAHDRDIPDDGIVEIADLTKKDLAKQ